jgi:hypothetical protein
MGPVLNPRPGTTHSHAQGHISPHATALAHLIIPRRRTHRLVHLIPLLAINEMSGPDI